MSGDLRYGMDSLRELVMIDDMLLMVRGVIEDTVDISFMSHELLKH